LDHCYTPFKRGYKAASLPPFGKSDHAAIFLLPEYKQRIAREAVVMREIRPRSVHVHDDMRDAMSDIDWDMFRSSSSDVSEFTDMVMSFISTVQDTIIPTVKVRSFPKQELIDPFMPPCTPVLLPTTPASYPATWKNTKCRPTDYGER